MWLGARIGVLGHVIVVGKIKALKGYISRLRKGTELKVIKVNKLK